MIKWRKRECYQQLYDYIYGDVSDRVFILYGLRRTGKTTLIRQLVADMDMAMKIVLSGTDSLGFMFTKDEALYDRCIMCHTTFIPYREFEKDLGIAGIDNYILAGNVITTMPQFFPQKNTDKHVDSAITRNIQHSLRNYEYAEHFRSLRDLYEKNELTTAIITLWRI